MQVWYDVIANILDKIDLQTIQSTTADAWAGMMVPLLQEEVTSSKTCFNVDIKYS